MKTYSPNAYKTFNTTLHQKLTMNIKQLVTWLACSQLDAMLPTVGLVIQ